MVRTDSQANHKNPKAAVTFLIHQEQLIPVPRAIFNSGPFPDHGRFCWEIENVSLIRWFWLNHEMDRTKLVQLSLPFTRKQGSSFFFFPCLFFLPFHFKNDVEFPHPTSYTDFVDTCEHFRFLAPEDSLDSLLESREGVKMGGLRAATGVYLCHCFTEASRT